MSYVNGFVTPVPSDARDAYVASAKQAWALLAEYGALEISENWGDKVPSGQHTDFLRAVDLRDGETIVFSWVRWPDRDTAERCEAERSSFRGAADAVRRHADDLRRVHHRVHRAR